MRKDLCEQARAYTLTLTLSLALTLHPRPHPRPRPHPHPKQFDAVLFNEEPGRCYGPITTPAGLHLIFLHSCREPKSRGEVRAPPASHPASPPHPARTSPRPHGAALPLALHRTDTEPRPASPGAARPALLARGRGDS